MFHAVHIQSIHPSAINRTPHTIKSTRLTNAGTNFNIFRNNTALQRDHLQQCRRPVQKKKIIELSHHHSAEPWCDDGVDRPPPLHMRRQDTQHSGLLQCPSHTSREARQPTARGSLEPLEAPRPIRPPDFRSPAACACGVATSAHSC